MSVLYATICIRVNVIKVNPTIDPPQPPSYIWGVRIGDDGLGGFGFTSLPKIYKTHNGALRAGRAAAYRWAVLNCEMHQGYRNAPRQSNIGTSHG